MPDKINNQKGVTLLLAMLIMTTIVGVSISLSVLIINQFEFSANLDHALVSLYAAESGLEESLNTIKIYRDEDTEDIGSALVEITSKSNISLNEINTAKWDSSSSNTTDDFILDSLKQNSETSFDLENVGSIEMTWHDDCDAPSWIKMSFVAWQENVVDFLPIPAGSYDHNSVDWPIFPCENELDTGICSTSTKNFPDNNYNYTVTINPITCNISYLKVKAYGGADLAGPQLNIGNKINIKSVGKYIDSQIAVSASVPYRLPPQGIFSFAIFSEASLEK